MNMISTVKDIGCCSNLQFKTRSILNSMINPAIMIDEMGVVLECNTLFEEFIKMSREEFINIDISSLEDSECCEKKVLLHQIYNGQGQEYEISYLTKEGNKVELKIHSSPVSDLEDQKIGRISIIEDMTELKEQQLKIINQERLAIIGQMGATIVHEARNFLSTIKGSSQLIELLSNEEKIKNYAVRISRNSDELNAILSCFLNMAKPRNAIREEHSLNDIINSMKEPLETLAMLKGVEIHFELDHRERYFMCDRCQIMQVLLNMYNNSIDSMCNTKKPTLTINTSLNEVSNEVTLRITDNGSGIASENFEKLGMLFFTTKKSGTGLGLSACYRIIAEHGGRIEVVSKEDIGTTFIINLPCIEELDIIN